MKITKFHIAGALCLLVFIIFGVAYIKNNIPQAALFIFLGIIIEAASFFIMTIAMPKDKDGECWLLLIPFTILLIISHFLLNWDLLLPFYISGIFSVASYYIYRYDRTEEKETDNTLVLKVILSGFASVFLFTCITGFVGVFV
jgi:hypothetical protein